MKKQWHLITGVEPGSIAEECGLEPGDRIGAINGHEIEDFFDYQYYIEEEFLSVEVLTRDDEECTLEIEKEEEEDLGLAFESFLMDEYNSCCNKCMFCFIDQMPLGMRDTLYFKDDDSRLSFLQGNYITLTNMKEKDVERVIRYHLAPINISVHTTNPELRCRMLHNRFAGDVLEKIRRFSEAGIPMNSQVVLCKGINDGEELDRTIRELGEFLPYMESLSVVPVGLTKYRDDLPKLDAFTREDAGKVLAQIQGWQKHFLEENGIFYPAAIISTGSLHDLHHVKPHRLTVVQPALHAEMIVHPADFPLFPYVHRLAGISLPAACPCFYFHDEKRISCLTDQVNLTPPALIIM